MPTLTPQEILHRIQELPSPRRELALHNYVRMYGPPAPIHTRTASDQSLYDACRWDLARFGRTFLPTWCTEDFNDVHRDYYARYRSREGSRGHLDATAAPRGHSKTTGCAMLGILHDCVYENERYIVYITNRAEHADIKVRDIRDELEGNAAITRVYGTQVGNPWNQSDFTTIHGVRVMAAGRGTQVRGITARAQRPTKVVIDDVEHPDHVLSEEQRDKTDNWLKADILKLGQPRTNIEIWGTILHPQSMLRNLMDTPGWKTRHYRAVESFADADSVPLWQAWREMYVDLANPRATEDALQYFKSHEADMLAGTRVLWPSRRDYYNLMCARIREGESSFWQELQGEPRHDAHYVFQMNDAAYCSVTPSGIERQGGTFVPYAAIQEIAAAWDPTPERKADKGGDFTSCPVIAKDKDGYLYVLDCYIAQEMSMEKQLLAVVNLLWTWSVPVVAVESNSFASLIPGLLREAMARKAQAESDPGWHAQIVPIVNMKNKQQRIRTLEPMIANRWLQFNRNLPGALIQQFADWLPIDGASKDDGPDSVELAIRTVKGMYDRRAAF